MILTCLIVGGAAFAAGAVLGSTASKAIATELASIRTEAQNVVDQFNEGLEHLKEGVEHLATLASPPAVQGGVTVEVPGATIVPAAPTPPAA